MAEDTEFNTELAARFGRAYAELLVIAAEPGDEMRVDAETDDARDIAAALFDAEIAEGFAHPGEQLQISRSMFVLGAVVGYRAATATGRESGGLGTE